MIMQYIILQHCAALVNRILRFGIFFCDFFPFCQTKPPKRPRVLPNPATVTEILPYETRGDVDEFDRAYLSANGIHYVMTPTDIAPARRICP